MQKPPFSDGIVNNIPGLKATKSRVVTIKSAFVKMILSCLAIKAKARKNTRAWNNTYDLPVTFFLKDTFLPSVDRRNPGLKAKKRAAGIPTLAEVISGKVGFIIYILWIFFCSKYIKKATFNKKSVTEGLTNFFNGDPNQLEGALTAIKDVLPEKENVTLSMTGIKDKKE